MRKNTDLKLIIFFTALTAVWTVVVIFAWEKVLLPPFTSLIAMQYPGDEYIDKRGLIGQRVEHFVISITVDLMVVTLLLQLVNRKQRKLVESEERYRTLFEHANDGIAVVNAADHKIIEVNNKFCEMFGFSELHRSGMDILELFRRSSDDANSAIFFKSLDEATSGESEVTIQVAPGAWLPASISFNTLVVDKVNLMILIVRDLSSRKQLEKEKEAMQRQLFQSSKLASIGELSAGVAHEINNPLNGMINFAQLLKDEDTRRSDFEQQMIDGIIDEGGRIAKIVRSLLTFARPDSHDVQDIQAAETIHASVALFGRQFERDAISLEIDMAENLPRLKADSSRLRQVIVNLLSNAHHALQVKPNNHLYSKLLRITVRRVEGKGGSPRIWMEFYDNGAGIRQADISKVFDPFFTSRRDIGGTGLGLSVSFAIIHEYGGTISVESEEGRFTRFIIELPAVVGDAPLEA